MCFITSDILDVDPSILKTELKMLRCCKSKQTIGKFKSLSNATEVFLSKSEEVRSLFSEVIKLLNLMMVVPASSATAERSFSCLRRLKTWLRSSMTQTRLNSVALLHAHRDVEPNLDLVLKDFVGLNELRTRIFGIL